MPPRRHANPDLRRVAHHTPIHRQLSPRARVDGQVPGETDDALRGPPPWGRGGAGGAVGAVGAGGGCSTPLSKGGVTRSPRSAFSGKIAYGGGAGWTHALGSTGSVRSLLFRIATQAMMSAVPIDAATTTTRSLLGLCDGGASQASSRIR